MRKRQLEIALQRLKPLGQKSARLEQYQTPARIAADVLWEAFAEGDIEGHTVADLGCGNGIFALGAKLLGASEAVGVDVDPGTVAVARENARALGIEVEFVTSDISEFGGRFDTVVQNPPFGAQNKHADRAFIRKSLDLAPTVYSLHLEGTEDFVVQMVQALGGAARTVKRFKFEIPYAFEFHRKASEEISVILLRFKR